MVNISFTRTEIKDLLNHSLLQVLSGITEYMDEINIDESKMEIKTDRFTYILSFERNKGS